MDELLSELGGMGAPAIVILIAAIAVGMLLAQVLGLIAWSIVRAARSGRPQRRTQRQPRRPTA